jgi:hypothetical protein
MQKLVFSLLSAAAAVALSGGCAQVRYAETAVGGAIDNPVTVPAAWGEVYCGRGVVCAEVEVVRVDAENRDGGTVDVILHNRTGGPRALQVSLEVIDRNGVKVDATNFQDVALEARQERSFTMKGINRTGHTLRVLLRQRAS